LGNAMNPDNCAQYKGIPPNPFEDLALETLLFARQAAREDVNVAKAVFGISSPVASLLASFTLPQARAIAVGNAHELRIRWNNNPDFWHDLLVACRIGDERLLAAVRRQGKLLFCGEITKKQLVTG
jgi:hypothetical protein